MPSRQTHRDFAANFVACQTKIKRGTNAATGATGTMYEVRKDGDNMVMLYWGTPVVIWHKPSNILAFQTNGHQTVTTKALINAVMEALQVKARLYQTDHVWNWHREGQATIPFKDGATFKITDRLRDLNPCRPIGADSGDAPALASSDARTYLEPAF